MEALATYLMKSSVWLTGFALVYALFLRNERFFTLNRIYLVSGILVSVIFPLFTWHYTVLLPVVTSVEVSDPQVQGIVAPEESFTMQNALLIFYLLGIIYLIFRIIRQTLPVFRIIKKSETHQYSTAKLIRTTEYPASFSFFSFVFVNPSIDEIETNEIVNHELEHIRQQHWIDLLLFEILRTMQWFNPVSWLYGHLIRQNHEYLADEHALQRSSNPAIYRAALLNQMFGGPVISLANSFNYSLNKKRFNMMKHTIKSPFRKLKLLLVLPLMAGIFYAYAAPEYKFTGGEENQSPQKSLYTITKDKIDIPFTTQLQKSDLDAVKSDLDKLGMKIDYTKLDFTKDGNLKQISAIVKRSDGGSVSFTSGELTTTNYPTFKTYPDGSFGVYSQKAVTGKVISEDGKPLKGASVIVSGKTIGTVSDASGNFKLVLTDDSPLVISYVGFESQKVNPDFGKEMVITMKTKIVEGNEATVSANASKPLEIPENVLIIMDGKESTRKGAYAISPELIESMNVLKGESAISKYGEKGKNGVIEITTKKKTSNNGNGNVISFYGNIALHSSGDTTQAGSLKKFTAKNPHGVNKDGTTTIKADSIFLFFDKNASSSDSENKMKSSLVIIDGKESSKAKMDQLTPEQIESVSILKDESAISKYGEKGKNGVIEITLKPKRGIFTMVEELPEFPGGDKALRDFLLTTMRYPTAALENGIQGKVIVGFMVSKNGEIKDVYIKSGVDPSLDKEAIRIIKSMPKWTPGKQNGEAVDCGYLFPINFAIPADYHPISKEKLK